MAFTRYFEHYHRCRDPSRRNGEYSPLSSCPGKIRVVIRPGHLLIDDLIGNRTVLSPGQHATLGRTADILVGADDPTMHRRFLQVWEQQGAWQIENIGSLLSARLLAEEQNRQAALRLGPGAILPLPLGCVRVVFDTREMGYEIKMITAGKPAPPQPGELYNGTWTEAVFEPSSEQRMLLEALATPLRNNPLAEPHVVVPSIEKLAAELGWTVRKTNQKMQRIVETLQAAGLPEFEKSDTKIQWRLLLARFAVEFLKVPGK